MEGITMKKLIIILSVLLTLALAGILYGTSDQPDKEKTMTAEQVYMNQFPDPIPSFVFY
jgi:hypothetical protein